ncbi:MAG TPA: PAC2 family protein [Thermoplasmata archaeon]|nr:PAC2 family protein [Thermoplasmata archaeon]
MEFVWRDEGPAEKGPGRGAVVLSSFPSAGLAATVASHYMVRSLKLGRVGRFDSPDVAPIAVVQGGEVNPTIRVYGRPGLGLVLSEFPPLPSQLGPIARTILDGAERMDARLLVCLEGVVPHPELDAAPDGSDGPGADGAENVWAAFSRKDPAVLEAFGRTQARALEEGVIGGVSGAMLVHGLGRKVPVAVLLVSTRAPEGMPDHRAGAVLIETLDRLLPELKIDTGPLRKQAAEIERMLRSAMKTRPVAPEPEGDQPPTAGMYG